jgi:hypothetical protein
MTMPIKIATLVACAASLFTPALAQVPAAVAEPNAAIVAIYHAEGAQIYECNRTADGKLAWQFREPIATLIADGSTVGHHFAGPSWELNDGSVVTGKAVGNVPGKTADDIPWLKLTVATHRGNGKLSPVDIVQRINTKGGALSGACDDAGQFRSVPYSADYAFLHKD